MNAALIAPTGAFLHQCVRATRLGIVVKGTPLVREGLRIESSSVLLLHPRNSLVVNGSLARMLSHHTSCGKVPCCGVLSLLAS